LEIAVPPKPRPIRIKETGEVVYGVRQAAETVGGDFSNVADCLRGERKTVAGYSFEYANEEEN